VASKKRIPLDGRGDFDLNSLRARAVSAEISTIATRRAQTEGPPRLRCNLRREKAYYVGFGPDAFDNFQEIAPRSVLLGSDLDNLFSAIFHDLSQTPSDYWDIRTRLLIQSRPMRPERDGNYRARTVTARAGCVGQINQEACSRRIRAAGSAGQNECRG
jgi:hypothetical protein